MTESCQRIAHMLYDVGVLTFDGKRLSLYTVCKGESDGGKKENRNVSKSRYRLTKAFQC